MDTNQMAKTKESNLSVTASGKKNNGSSNGHTGNSGQNKSIKSKNTSYNNSHECSDGVCSTTWKPIQHLGNY